MFCNGLLLTLKALISCTFVLLILYVIYLTGEIGAGDVKLYSVIPLFYFGDEVLLIYLIVFFVAAVLALGRFFLLPSKRKQLLQILIFLKLKYLKRINISMEIPLQNPDRIPMAVPMAIGILVSMILKKFGILFSR